VRSSARSVWITGGGDLHSPLIGDEGNFFFVVPVRGEYCVDGRGGTVRFKSPSSTVADIYIDNIDYSIYTLRIT
jgi:hypothetical protein